MTPITAPSTVTVSGTTLFHLAVQAYGDATLWNRIAYANGLVDPWISGIATLVIPRDNGKPGNGGILGDV